MAKYPRPTKKEVGKRYKRYRKITKGAGKEARMTEKQFIKFNYPSYYKTSRTRGVDAALRAAGVTEKEIRSLGGK